MPARNSKGRFVKGGGKSKAIVRYRTKQVTKYRTRSAPKHHRRRRGGHGRSAGMSLLGIGGAALGLNYLLSQGTGSQAAIDFANKIPGAKTFGAPAAAGLACLAVDRFVKPNKWLKLAGIAGIVMAASTVGQKGKNFQWVGDDEIEDLEIGDDDDYDDGE